MIFPQSLSALLLLQLAAAGAWAQPGTRIPTTESIVARMSQARAESRTRLRPFEVVRSYKLFGKDKQKTKSEVTADITYVPPDVQHYTIHKANGLGLGEVIVRKILDSENEVLTKQSASEISMANYAFRFIREDTLHGQPCYLLELRPLRKATKLLYGTAWIDETSYLILRVEGQPAQAPSWWIHNIHIALDFHVVNGMWLQTALQSTANVRLLGQHTIVSRDVEYRMGGLDAGVRIASHEND